ncbi:MAG: proline iminopeptidase [Sphingomonadales bacterium]|jgi:proline iminopeptidase|nr:proline iminopeptidase [Sphingomonadales bacterium]
MVRLLVLLLLLSVPALADPSARLSPGEHQAVVNDVRLWYRVAGRTSGVPVVFLHGGPGEGSQTFAQFAGPALEPELRMVYLDQRGSGRSERPWNQAYSLDLLVEDLERLRIAWGVPKIALIGHSFGTILALEYAARHADHVYAVVLAASVPDIPAAIDLQCERLSATDPEAFARARAALAPGGKTRCNIFQAYSGDKAKAFITANMFPKPETGRMVDAADSEGALRNTGELGRALFASGLLDYRLQRAERVTAPVLIVAGGSDHQAMVEPQRALASRLPRGRILEYPGLGHFMFVEDPARFGRDVAAFFKNPR